MRLSHSLLPVVAGWGVLAAQTLVTLSPTTSPPAGEAGVTSVSVTGNNFPSGGVPAASTTVTLNPATGTGPSATATPTAVTTIVGTTRRVTFTIPSSISVSVPTAYVVSISGTTTTGTAFASSNQASLTINPGGSISGVNPNTGQQGQQNLLVTITGQGTNFVQGGTQASFGPGISVGGAAAGAFGPLTVANATTATATLSIAAGAALGTQTVTVQTASEQASLNNGFTVTASIPMITQMSPASGQQGQTLTGVAITGASTHFTQATPTVTFSSTGVTASAVVVIDNTHLTATVTIASNSMIGASNVTVVTGAETATGAGLFAVGSGSPTITQVSPVSAQQGQTLTGVVVIGASTHFTQATPTVTFSSTGVTASNVQVIDNTHLTTTITIAASAATGASNVTVVTGTETATGTGLFTVASGTPIITTVSPPSGQQGHTLTGVVITGAFTHFMQATPVITFSTAGVTANLVLVTDNTHLTVAVTITATAATGAGNVTVVTGPETATGAGLFTVTAVTPIITRVNPTTGQPGQTLPVAITGQSTHFVQGTTTANFGAGITVNSTAVTDATDAVANITIAPNAAPGPSTVIMTTGTEVAGLVNGFTITVAALPTITDFNPKSAPVGTLITITGANLQPNAGTSAQVTLAKQNGGTLAGPVSSTTATSLSFVIPAGAATGALSVTVNRLSASAAVPLTVVPASTFTLTALPNPANLIQGQSTAYAVSLTSASGFNQLAALNVTGIPASVTAAFQPQQITAGQTSILTMSAPIGQAVNSSALTLSASALVNGISVVQSTPVTLNVQAVTTSFLGRTVVSDSLQTTLVGVTIKMLGLDGNGNTTGCTGGTVSDGGGNFMLTNLPPMCVGPQLVGFDGTTVTSPSGKYAGVNLVFTFASGQVTVSPVLVHLPRIDNVETFFVTQNSASNQSYSFNTIPGLSVTVYAGTTFTLADGTQPNPFPLAAIQVPVDRLPDAKPQVPTMMRAFIVAFQPANATTNEPVAVLFPNTLSTLPGTDMALMTLDPTHGQMVPYGTGSVNSNGTQIVPDADPAHPGHLYGLVHFDWHGPMPPPPPGSNPAPPGGGPTPPGGGGACGPGPGPAGGYGPGGTCVSPTPPVPPSLPTCTNTQSSENRVPDSPNTDGPAQAGDPVDLFSGIDVITNTDISISGSRGSLSLVRTYRSLSSNPGPFGIGTGHNYSLVLNTAFLASGKGIVPIVEADGNQFFFTLTGGGFTNSTIPALSGAVLTSNLVSGTHTLRWRNGTTYVFQSSAFGGLEAFLTTIIDANGNKISLTLNPSQPLQITQITDAVGRSLTLSYDGSNRITSITDPIGRTVQYTYNPQGTLATVTDLAGGITKYTYDSNNNLLTITDPRENLQAQNTLDSLGRVVKQVRPDGGTLTFSYAFLNPDASTSQVMQAQVTDSEGVQAIYRFNPTGFVTDVTATQGQTRHLTRAAGTNLLLSVTESSSTQSYTYDANGNILSSTDATGLTTQFTYDPVFNKVTSITDPLGNVSRFTYDGNGNLLKSTDANDHASSYQYDPTGLLLQATDALNQTTKFAYDGFGNLTTVTDPLGNATSYIYDGISRLIQTKDSLGRVTSFTYDALGRLVTRTDAKSGMTTFVYDLNGNLLSVKDARNNITMFTYDVMNRLVTRTNPLGQTDTRTYDTNGNLVKFVDRRGQTSTFAYDNLNRLVGESYTDAAVTRTYDVLGRLAQVNDSVGGVFAFSYDPVGRLTSSATQFGTVNYAYDGRGEMASRQVAGQPAVSYTYDPVGNLGQAAMPQAAANFAYNPRNQLENISRLNGVSTAYTYDNDARLQTLTHANGSAIIDAESYAYDAVGNRAGHSTSIGQSLITQPTLNQYNVANQLIQFGSVPDSYDANGNLVQEGTTTAYTWDGRNRLKAIVTATGQTTNFTYDFAGNLIAQADSGTNLNLTKYFVVDSLTNVAYESATDGSSYLVVSGRSIDNHLAIVQSGGQVQYGLSDAVNSTVATVDQTGVIKSQFLYDAYGQTTTTGTYPFQFTGRVPVSASLYYYRARFYNSQTGRFISEDPIGFAGGPNLYGYVRNSPIGRTDPSGAFAIGVVVGGLYGGLSGALGSYAQGGNWKDVAVGGLIGAGTGAAIGALDPSEGVGTIALISGVAGAAGDVAGQLVGTGGNFSNINWYETAGAGIGGALGGYLGADVALSLLEVGYGEWTANIVGGLAGLIPSIYGGRLGQIYGTGRQVCSVR